MENKNYISFDQFESICRTCLSSENLHSLFTGNSDKNTSNSIVDMLMAIANVQIQSEDCLPSKICDNCIKILDSAIRFKQQCEESEIKLRNVLDNIVSFSDCVKSEISNSDNEKYANSIQNNPEDNDQKSNIYTHFEDGITTETDNEFIQRNFDKKLNKRIKKCKIKKKSNSDKSTKTCDICSKEVLLKYLKGHLRRHFADKTFHCETCGYKFQQKSNYLRHLKIHTGERPFKCDICNKSFIQAFALKEHLRVHTQERPYQCEFCDKSYKQSGALLKHQRKHSLEESEQANNNHKCKICSKSFSSTLGLNAHSRMHSIVMFSCSQCNKQFITKKLLDNHILNHSAPKDELDVLHSCTVCKKNFTKAKSLAMHMKLHSANLFLCNYCGKGFINKPKLNIHLRVHTDERPFMCSYCPKAFKTTNALRIHKFAHTGERPFSCNHCDKSFHQSAHLVAHMRTHTGEKPYSCVICGKNFAAKFNLTVHMRIHSGE